MNKDTESAHLESIPELTETLRHRVSVVQRETNLDGNVQNIEDLNKSTTSNRPMEENCAKQDEINEVLTEVNQCGKLVTDSTGVHKDEWTSTDYYSLPPWLQHNDCLLSGHRPPLPSFAACFQSIFRIHTETVNIWSHLFGCIVFIVLAIFSLSRLPHLQDKLAFTPFFAGAILCLGFSFIFHTLHCHSPQVMILFSRLDYCGIALLITGSFVPWLYFCFYCHFWPKVIYLVVTSTLGICAVTVSLLKTFGEASYRPLRAAVFTTFGLSGIAPSVHFLAIVGWDKTIIIPLTTFAFLYILGAALYAYRVPERLLPGRCDIWFHSHQVFHVLVVIATLINYQGLISVYNRSVTMKCP